jgi:hypothetical protein
MGRMTIAVGLVLAGLVVSAPAASAGGWAVSTVDAVPSPRAGERVDVGFTVRQHGVSPVNVEGEVGVVVRGPSGDAQWFPAQPSGRPGHYVARLAFAEPGEVSWTIRQGMFGEQDLGTVLVAGAGAADPVAVDTAPAGGRYRWPAGARYGLLALAALLTSVVCADVVLASRRRRPRPAAG